MRREVTPLTTFVVSAEQRWDRFLYSPLRDADGLRITPGFEFKPFALIDGNAFVGYPPLPDAVAEVPDYTGLAASVDLGYTLRATRFSGKVNRDVTYSFDEIEPYYVQTDASLTVVQRVTTHWDVKANVLHALLDYQAVARRRRAPTASGDIALGAVTGWARPPGSASMRCTSPRVRNPGARVRRLAHRWDRRVRGQAKMRVAFAPWSVRCLLTPRSPGRRCGSPIT